MKTYNFIVVCCLSLMLSFSTASQRYKVTHVKLHQDAQTRHCTILSESIERACFKQLNSPDGLHIEFRPAQSPVGDANVRISDNSQIVNLYSRSESVIQAEIKKLCSSYEPVEAREAKNGIREIRKIVDNGDQSNRIDVVFMGDGYTLEEQDQFFSDMERLIQDMFNDVTFRSYLPVFNIWGIFEPSVDSGIGYDGPLNTAFMLYREAGQLRAIYPGNASYARQICALTGPSGCDYPSLIGNDDFYGGLGGEFVISTKGERTGTVVLRHEMGHNFVDVGEEYDGGYVYSGVNSAPSVAAVGWTHWLTGELRAERSMIRIQDYRWADLSTGDQSFPFTSDGTYHRWHLTVSVSAAGEEDSLEFILDGQVLDWNTTGFDDREFYNWEGTSGFTAGNHELIVRSKTNPTHPFIPRMICSVTLHEFGDESEYEIPNSHVSAYPTWDIAGRVTYRPTNAGCLMRNMSHPLFCEICQEGMWYQFFMRIGIIDSVTISDEVNPTNTRTVTLNTVRLGQLRDPENIVEGERLEVRWFWNDLEYTGLRDQFTVDARAGNWRVEVKLVTPEVRSDPDRLLEDSEEFVITI